MSASPLFRDGNPVGERLGSAEVITVAADLNGGPGFGLLARLPCGRTVAVSRADLFSREEAVAELTPLDAGRPAARIGCPPPLGGSTLGWDLRAVAPGVDVMPVREAARAAGYDATESAAYLGGYFPEFLTPALAAGYDRLGAFLAGPGVLTPADLRECMGLLAFAFAAAGRLTHWRDLLGAARLSLMRGVALMGEVADLTARETARSEMTSLAALLGAEVRVGAPPGPAAGPFGSEVTP